MFVLIAIVLGCSSSGADCVGTVTHQGKTYEGKDKSAEQAKLNACNHFCREADPEYDAMYRIWLRFAKRQSRRFSVKKGGDF